MEKLLLEELLGRGADFARVHFRKTEKHTLTFTGGEFTSLATEETETVRVMALRGSRFADKTYDLGGEDRASGIAEDVFTVLEAAPASEETPSFGAGAAHFDDLRASFDAEEMKTFLLGFRDAASAAGAELTSASVSYEKRDEHSLSSSGEDIRSVSDGYTYSYHAILTKDGRTVDPFVGRAACRSLRDAPGIDPILARSAPLLFRAEPLAEPFEGTLIAAPACGYYLLMDFLFGQLFEDNLPSGVWRERFGEQVVSGRFSAALDPFEPSVVFGERIHASGNVSAGYDIIRDGVLKNGILSPQAAAALGRSPSANDGDNLVVSAGSRSVSELISEVSDGVLLFSFSGECSSDGGFTGVGRTAFRIRDGRIVSAIDSCQIAGNWFDILSSDRFAFSRERECSGESVIPWISVQNIRFS